MSDSAASVHEAAEALFQFLWNEKSTNTPPEELLSGYAAMETHEDYDKEERLTIALGRALGHEIE